MCGILVAVRHASRLDQLETVIGDSVLRTCIRRRGPDHLGEAHTGPHETGLQVHFLSSVLHLRSNKLVEQPFLCRNGSILGWNGELYRGIDGAEEAERSDTALVADALESTTDSSQILECFSRLEGEFAFAFYHAPTATLWFGRDRFGRRSLVWRRNAEGLELSSVACRGKDFQEVPTMGLFSLELGAAGSRLSYHRWHADSSGSPPIPDALEGPPVGLAVPTFLNLTGHNLDVPSPVDGGLDALLRARIQIVADFEKVLGPSVRRRVCNVQRTANEQASIAILFSGGLDCTVLAYLAGKAAPDGETIDLLNVAFENPRSLAAKAANKNANPERDKYNVPDRDTARRSVLNLRQALPDREFRLVEINVPFEETKQYRDRILDLMFPSATVMDLVCAAGGRAYSRNEVTLLVLLAQSIAMAFWFAVRGESDGFVSRAKVLLSGLGADELLGGYCGMVAPPSISVC